MNILLYKQIKLSTYVIRIPQDVVQELILCGKCQTTLSSCRQKWSVIRLPNNIQKTIRTKNLGQKKRDCLTTTPVPIIH